MDGNLFKHGYTHRQRTVIQETLRILRTTTTLTAKVQHISTLEGVKRSHRSLTQETLKTPRISTYTLAGGESLHVCLVEEGETCMTPYRHYLADGILLLESTEDRIIKKNSSRYTLVDGNLFRHGYTHPILTCVSGEQCTRIMKELHEGICESNIGGRTLLLKAIHVGYYWSTMREDCTRHAQRCEQCERHADWHNAPPEELRSVHSPWLFHIWGIDILGPPFSGTSNEVPVEDG